MPSILARIEPQPTQSDMIYGCFSRSLSSMLLPPSISRFINDRHNHHPHFACLSDISRFTWKSANVNLLDRYIYFESYRMHIHNYSFENIVCSRQFPSNSDGSWHRFLVSISAVTVFHILLRLTEFCWKTLRIHSQQKKNRRKHLLYVWTENFRRVCWFVAGSSIMDGTPGWLLAAIFYALFVQNNIYVNRHWIMMVKES